MATAQAGMVAELIDGAELVVIESSGAPADDKARWTRSLDEALLDGSVDMTIHSAKDVPAERPDGVITAAVPLREDPRDSICGALSLDGLAAGARVGTASPRRTALLGAFCERATAVELRGNVDTRLRKLDEGTVDAAILAAAGLNRLGIGDRGNPMDPTVFTPAPGQGSLLVETLASNSHALELASAVNHENSALALQAERALVIELGADCHTALGALATVSENTITLEAICLAPDGSTWIRDRISGSTADPAQLGRNLAKSLRVAGADELLGASRGELA